MHAQKVLLDVIGPIELFQAHIAMERLIVLVNVFVTREEVTSIGGIRTIGAAVSLLDATLAVASVGSVVGHISAIVG